jgi:hypothetical protein
MKKAYIVYLSIIFAVLISVCTFSSCKKSDSTKTTTNANVAGSWSGTVFNTGDKTTYTVSFTLAQPAGNITGEFTTTGANGSVTGTVSGDSIVLILTPAASSGYTEVDTFKGMDNAAANEITGTFSSTVNTSGTFDIKKN